MLLPHIFEVLVEPELLLFSLDLSSDLARTILYVVPHFALHDYGAALLALSGLASAERYMLLVLIISDGNDELAVLALNWLHRAILQMILHQVPLALGILAVLTTQLYIFNFRHS